MTFDLKRSDTICALATSSAPAAIAVVRVSGPRAHEVRERVFRPRRAHEQRAFVATLGDVHEKSPPQGRALHSLLDEAICTWFPEGKSYTGEASFELSLHGNPVVVRSVLALLVAHGCRLAEPGELTLRAVLTGRLDLTSAEAVDDVIHARTDAAARAALRALKGGLRDQIEPVRASLIDALAEIEARLDFPDEDLGDADRARLVSTLEGARAQAQRLLDGAQRGTRLREGARIVLYGPPNAGKSTLLNVLVGRERALVHDEPGTTRDVLEAELELDGIACTLVDVAGVRPLHEAGAVERLGIARAESERGRADVVVGLVPAQQPDALSMLRAMQPDIAVLTKIDLDEGRGAQPPPRQGAISLSAKTGAGVDALRAVLAQRIGGTRSVDEEALLMRERQVACVQDAHDAIVDAQRVVAADRSMPGEVLASELRRAARALDRLLGKDVSQDVLDAIFARFCIGK